MTGPALYQHRPTVVRAIQWNPGNRAEVDKWLAVNWPGGYQFSEDGSHLVIETPEGDRDCSAEDGYWLVEGVAHELYCVRPDVFARVYEPAGEPPGNAYVPPGVPRCGADCSHGGTCTAAAGHTGDHATHGPGGVGPYCTWPQGAAS